MTDHEPTGRFPQLHALGRNLKTGLRGAFFLRLPLRENDVSWTQLMLLVLLGLVIHFAWDFFSVGLDGQVNTFGFPGALFRFPVLLFAAWVAAQLRGEAEKTLRLAVVFCALVIPFEVWTPMLRWLPRGLAHLLDLRWGYGGYPQVDGWIALSCGVAAARVLAFPRRLARLSVWLPVAAIIGLAFTQIFHDRSLWTMPYDPETAGEELAKRHSLDQEAVFYLQPKLLQQQLDGVVPQRHEGINLFFVGVAGYADQDVFLKEIKYVDKLFKDRFGTAGHSILLANNPGSATQLPIASATSIGLALKKVGDTMDKDQDILFLYLTSHGSRDHVFTLDFGDMRFDDLNPPRLRKLLDDSGIKHRVVVVGACYSGGFIDALKNDNTLVITSAAPDRTSFGCSDEEDFTYFGRAYFADALNSTDSFIDAFTLAKPIVAAREKEDDYTPSDPRIDVGVAIKQPLEVFARQQREARAAQDVAKYKLRPDIVAASAGASVATAVARPGIVLEAPAHDRGAPKDEKLQVARELVELTRYQITIQDEIDRCKEYSKTKDSPEKVFEKNPNAFQGLTPKSAAWPKLVEALSRYWEHSCNSLSADTYLDVFTRGLASGMSRQELDDAKKFLASPSGQAFITASMAGAKSLEKESTNQAKVAQQNAMDEYKKTLAELVAADPKAKHAEELDTKPWWHFW